MQLIGVMSGTSLDGIDAVLVDFNAAHPAGRSIDKHFLPYPDDLRNQLLDLHQPGNNELHKAMVLAQTLSALYAETCQPLLDAAHQCAGIACHGQTIRHRPESGYTLQLINGALLAELTRTRVITDFRNRDIAAGGQGAPLVPAFHAMAFHHAERHRAIVNIGGIANITFITPNQCTTGFDCGPGNLLMNAWCQIHTGQAYDHNGAWAASGTYIPALLQRLLLHPFFVQQPPKSAGREQFNLAWLQQQLDGNEPAQDVQATLLQFTARTITQALHHATPVTQDVYLCGGGAYNPTLVEALKTLNPRTHIASTQTLGIEADQVEAHAFAWLGYQTLRGLPGNNTDVTGASHPCVLGCIYPA